ncbi:MAG: hypothetical protein ABSE73_30395 [Planctomycetota bacterium]
MVHEFNQVIPVEGCELRQRAPAAHLQGGEVLVRPRQAREGPRDVVQGLLLEEEPEPEALFFVRGLLCW